MTMRSIICHSCHRFCTHRILYPIVLAYILDTLYNIGVGYNKTKETHNAGILDNKSRTLRPESSFSCGPSLAGMATRYPISKV
jgi:hypothetical protein